MTSRKVQIEFDGRQLDMIDVCRRMSHRKTVADVVRDALMLYDWCRRAIVEGYTICAVKDGVQREPLLAFTAEARPQ